MKNNVALIRSLIACGIAAALCAQPALAQVVPINPTPLASAGGNVLPNLMFTLDDSGSMANEYNPDYVAGSGMCLSDGSNTTCNAGDPPFAGGGEFGLNGVGYDPNFSYLTGVNSDGTFRTNPPTGNYTLPITNVNNDPFKGGSNVDLTSKQPDIRYCNPNTICMVPGQTDSATSRMPSGLSTNVLVGGTDDTGTTMGAGQFPYRSTATNKSFNVVSGAQTNVIALPEMMQLGTFVRNTKNVFIGTPTSTVRVTTVETHGLATNDAVYTTGTGTTNLNVICLAVTKVDANNFTFNSTSTNAANTTGSWRKCTPATFTRSSNVTTVTGTGNGLVINDQVTIVVGSNTTFNASPANVASVATNTFTYANNASNVTTAVNGFYVRTGLYNKATTTQGPGVAYRIVPIEFCADANLTDCIQILPPDPLNPTTPATAPADHPFPAFVRFCRTQEEAVAHGAVTFILGTPRVNRCQSKFIDQTITGVQKYTFARLGLFVRDTIVSTGSFTGRPNRTDCANVPVSCTYNEEIQNYAKWFAYYRSRMLMMKTSVGISFRSFVSNPTGTPPRPDSLRIGLITIHAGDTNPITTAMYLRINNFNTTQAASLYSKFYALTPGNGTPLREALSRTGWIFAGKVGTNTGLTAGIPAADDPVQSSCQKNYALLTTDGFWNGNGGQDLAGNALTNWDNIDGQIYTPANVTPVYTDAVSSRGTGTYDGVPGTAVDAGSNSGGTSGTLADVALYYYMTDLRGNKDKNNNNTGPSTSPATTPAGGDVATNNIPSKPGNKDFALHQHMVTYTLGLADGLMSYDANYEKAAGDFANIKSGVTNSCFWVAANAPCDWPVPVHDEQSALDDLWHAAVNGRGTYFQATNPRSLSNALSAALTGISATDGSAAAAATSSPNITPKDNFAFSTTYQSNTWSGVVKAQKIDPVSGNISPTILWRADTQLLTQVAATSDARNIFMTDPTSTGNLKPFQFGSMTLTEQAFFTKHCTTAGAILSQCALANLSDRGVIENGSALVGFLRGQTGNEVNATTGVGLFRDRTEVNTVNQQTLQTILGDIIDATPAYIRVPEFNYTDTGYSDFKLANTNRTGTLYVAANDGLLHAFDNATDANGNPLGLGQTCPQSLPVVAPGIPVAGCESWSYMPKFVMPNIYQIADTHYTHRYQLDGSPEIGDVFDTGAGVWKTIIVGGANGGARGYYALDITDPRNPKGLWEFCSDVILCPNTGAISHSDPDLGFTYGNPVIGKQLSDGTWVVILTSGLNNVTPGTGSGFFFVLDAITGRVLSKVSTGVGDTTNGPSNLMKHAGFYKAGLVDATISFVYGGDMLGNVWRLDMSTNPPVVTHMATLRDAGGKVQPITVRPLATNLNNFRVYYVGTGRYISSTDPSDTSQQTIYGFKDKDADYGTNIRTANLVVQTLSVGNSRTITNNTVNWATQDGFLIDLNPNNDSPGERIIVDPRLELGTLIFTSNVPASGAGCSPGGNSFVYNFDYSTGSYIPGTANGIAGVSQGAFLVGLTPIQTTDGSIRTINTDSSGGLGTGTVNINKNPTAVSRFSYRER